MIIDTEMTMLSGKIYEYKLSKYETTTPLFLFLEGKMHQNQPLCYHFYASVLVIQYLRWN